jgi:hypothetical protein
MHALKFCSTLDSAPSGTPLGKCIESYNDGTIQLDTTPTKPGSESYPLTEQAQNFVLDLLNAKIPLFSKFTLTSIELLRSIHKKCRDLLWAHGTYWDTLMVGSTTPLPNTPLKKDWHNIDLILRVRLPQDALNARDYFETLVTDAIKEFVSPSPQDSSFIKFKRLDALGTIITVGNENRSLDLLLWYENDYLPELFTMNALALPFHSLILPNSHPKPLTVVPTNQIDSALMLSDRRLHIVRYQPTFRQGSTRNLGVFVKLLILKTKGYLQPQQGLEELQRAVYLNTRKGSVKVIDDLFNSFKEHLPQTTGAYLAHWLHWMLTLNDSKGIPRRFEPPKSLLRTDKPFFNTLVNFLNTNQVTPQHFAHLLKIVAMIGYLQNQSDLFTLGIWDGTLHLRFKLDSQCYFQFPFEPHEIIRNALSFAVSPVTRSLLLELFKHLRLTVTIKIAELSRYTRTLEEDKNLMEHFLGILLPSAPVPPTPLPAPPPRKIEKKVTAPKTVLPLNSLLQNTKASSKHIFENLQMLHNHKATFTAETSALAKLLNRALSNSVPPQPTFSSILSVLETILTEISWNDTLQAEHQLGTRVLTRLGRIVKRTKSPEEGRQAIKLAQQIYTDTSEAAPYKAIMEEQGLISKPKPLKGRVSTRKPWCTRRQLWIGVMVGALLISIIAYMYFKTILKSHDSASKYINRGLELCQFPHQHQWFSPEPHVIDQDGGTRLRELPEVLSMRVLELFPNGTYRIILFETNIGHFLCEATTPLCRLLSPEGVARAMELASKILAVPSFMNS